MTERQLRTGPPPPGPGRIEAALEKDLASLPAHLREGTLAASARVLARRIDNGMSAHDAMAAHREIRITMGKLGELAPAASSGDYGDQLAAKRQERLTNAASQK